LLVCIGMEAHALPPSILKLSEYQKQDWQVEDGLPENNVRMIAQRPDAFFFSLPHPVFPPSMASTFNVSD